jgi:hypothetical protein
MSLRGTLTRLSQKGDIAHEIRCHIEFEANHSHCIVSLCPERQLKTIGNVAAILTFILTLRIVKVPKSIKPIVNISVLSNW